MSEWVSLDVVEGVGPVALKRRRPKEDEGLLDHEAAVLSAIDHAGVVRLIERRQGPEPAVVTRFVATRSLATAPAPSIDDALRLVSSLTLTIADLHRLGVRHGALHASHVLLGPGGRPVLCGFSRATMPGTPVDECPTPADDIAALGRLMTRLLAGHDGLEPIPPRRSIRRGQWGGYRQRALLTLADHCQADDPDARPSAAGLAGTIAELVGTGAGASPARTSRWRTRLRTVPARLGRLTASWPWPAPGTLSPRRSLVLGLVVAGLVAGAVAFRTLRPSTSASVSADSAGAGAQEASGVPGERRPAGGGRATAAESAGANGAGPTTGSTARRPQPSDCPDATPVGVDTDGDGCADGPAIIEGHTITVGDDRFVLGRPEDRVLVGDWDCDGLSTAVLIRSAPPGLWHFPTWSPPGETVAAQLVSDQVTPESITRRPDAGGCDALVAGGELVVELDSRAASP